MNKQEIKASILQLLHSIAPDINPEEMEMDDKIIEVFNIDSFDFLQFIISIDEKFGIKTSEENYNKITTLNTLISYIKLAKE